MLESPLPPGSTIGILGGGQLGRMLAMAAARLGLKTHIYSDEQAAPAFDVAAAARVVPVFPPAKSFAVAQDRLIEKDFLTGLGIPVAPYARVDTSEDLRAALSRVRVPALLKTRRFGYDGKGQIVIRAEDEIPTALEAIGQAPALIEGVVLFEREISVIVVRGQDGALAFYDAVENVHQGGILAISRAPAHISQSSSVAARMIAGKVAEALSHVGVLCVEMFERAGERPELVVNEFAPRVHNSGHWTLDACLTSQFENHVRAICGWPLGETARHSDAVMTNLIGADVEKWREFAAGPGILSRAPILLRRNPGPGPGSPSG